MKTYHFVHLDELAVYLDSLGANCLRSMSKAKTVREQVLLQREASAYKHASQIVFSSTVGEEKPAPLDAGLEEEK